MIDPKDFKKVPDWLLGGFWIDQKFVDLEGQELSTKEFGDNKFHGRTHPSIAYMSIMRFTRPGDEVYIPFAGSGTEVDICVKYKRLIYAIDINPLRKDIFKGDATQVVTPRPVKLIIAHPPYEDIIKYGDEQRDLSKRGQNYVTLVKFCAWKFRDCLEIKGKLVLIIGSVYRNSAEVPLDYIWYNELVHSGFKLIGRIVRDFGETKGKGKDSNLWKYRLLKFGRFYLKNDFVLIFERVK